jgi:hypothetical protein
VGERRVRRRADRHRIALARRALVASCHDGRVLGVDRGSRGAGEATLAPLFALGGAEAVAGRFMLLVSALLLLAQLVAVLWFLRFWLRPDVRRAFD